MSKLFKPYIKYFTILYSFFTKRFAVEICTTLECFSKHIFDTLFAHPSVNLSLTEMLCLCINKAIETFSNNLIDSKSRQSVTVLYKIALI